MSLAAFSNIYGSLLWLSRHLQESVIMNFRLDIGSTAQTLLGYKRQFCIDKHITRVLKWCTRAEFCKCGLCLCFGESAVSEVALRYQRLR